MNGLILIDKPAGCTSHDVVNRWRKLAGTKRAGHLGTLDPMATGLLVLVTGVATRLAQFYGKSEKTYLAEITFGAVSNTYDAEGDISAPAHPIPSAAVIIAALDEFRQQVPVDLKPVEVEVKQLQVEYLEENRLSVLVTCTAGTYIRSIAHDLGQRLGCGALLSSLRRIHSGEFSIDQARSLDQLAALAGDHRLTEALIPIAGMLPEMPSEHFDLLTETHIRQGRDFRTSPFVVPPGAPFVKALSHSGELIAIGELKIPNLYHPTTVF
jgi:tRNA pseudouridine55 synthase